VDGWELEKISYTTAKRYRKHPFPVKGPRIFITGSLNQGGVFSARNEKRRVMGSTEKKSPGGLKIRRNR